jgi:hypothetical protein
LDSWLRDGGFDAGTHVKVIVVRDKLVITKDGNRARRDQEKKLAKLQSTVYTLQQELTQQGELF